MAATLYAHDTKYGTFTLTYDPSTGWFKGCKTVSFSAVGNCGSVASTAITHTLKSASLLTTSWVGGVQQCPVTSTCATTTNQSFNWFVVSNSCNPFNSVFNVDMTIVGAAVLGYSAFTDSVTVNETP
jgi:hypothetical protein